MNASLPKTQDLSLSNEYVIENIIRSNGFDIYHKVLQPERR